VAITLCEIQLWQDDKRGWGDAGIASAVFKQPPPPPNAVGACASGADPNRAADPRQSRGPYATVDDFTLTVLYKAMADAYKTNRLPRYKADSRLPNGFDPS
jgi:hypothetical protein